MKSASASAILRITEARYEGDSRVWVRFNDGQTRRVDLAPLLAGPAFRPLQNESELVKLYVDPVCGVLAWPIGVDLAPEALLGSP